MKWDYYHDNRYLGGHMPTCFRRAANGTYEHLKYNKAWGFSEPRFIKNSIKVPDLLLILMRFPL